MLLEKVRREVCIAGFVSGVSDVLQHQGLVVLQGECAGTMCEFSETRLPGLCWVLQPTHPSSGCFTEFGRGISGRLWLHWRMSGNRYSM